MLKPTRGTPRRARSLVAGLTGAALAASALIALPAHAAKVSVGCAGLQNALTNAGTGDLITLTKMCTGKAFTLPSRRITLKGAKGAGFDGTGAPASILYGTNVSTTTIRDLIFRNATGNYDGAAILIGGNNSAPRIVNSTFRNNGAVGGAGGAISIDSGAAAAGPIVLSNNTFGGPLPSQGSIAGHGGAAYLTSDHGIQIVGNVFRNNTSATQGGALWIGQAKTLIVSDNTFSENSAESAGGGMLAYVSGTATIARNLFDANRLQGGSPPGRHGGAIFLFASGATPIEILQHDNVFKRNVLAMAASTNLAGGGEYIDFNTPTQFLSRNDRYIRNRVEGDGHAGGLKLGTVNLDGEVLATLSNATIAGNAVTGTGWAGGLYTNVACISTCSVDTELLNSTISGNSLGSGSGRQMYTQSNITVRNSIVYGNGSASDLEIVGGSDFQESDACGVVGDPRPGAGNICADPKLKAPAQGDVHQTKQSPTRDAGSNSFVPSGLNLDFEGHRRILDSNNDGSKRVDMGADEMRTRARISVGIRRGSVIVAGSLRPTNRGKKVIVTLARKRGGKFRRLGTKRDRLNKRSRYRVTFADPAPGACKVKVVFKGSATTLPGTKTKKFRC